MVSMQPHRVEVSLRERAVLCVIAWGVRRFSSSHDLSDVWSNGLLPIV